MPSVTSTTPTLQEAASRPLPPRPKFAFNWASDSDEDDVLPTKSATTTTTSMPHHKTNNDTTSTTTPRGSSTCTTTKTASHKIENTPSASSTKSRTDDADGDVGLSEDENGNNNNKTSNYNAFHTLSGTTTPTDSPAITAVARELLFHCEGVSSSLHEFSAAAVVAPRHCNEVTILAPIPYKLKSVWSGTNNSSLANTPSRTAAATSAAAAADTLNNNNNNYSNSNNYSKVSHPHTPSSAAAMSSAASSAFGTPSSSVAAKRGLPMSSSSATALSGPPSVAGGGGGTTITSPSSGAARPLRMNRALDELTAVLRQGGGSLPYDELMARSQWRSRFQPSFGSLFTFLKRNRCVYSYHQSVVRLVEEGAIVTELLKMSWPAVAPPSPASLAPSAPPPATAAVAATAERRT